MASKELTPPSTSYVPEAPDTERTPPSVCGDLTTFLCTEVPPPPHPGAQRLALDQGETFRDRPTDGTWRATAEAVVGCFPLPGPGAPRPHMGSCTPTRSPAARTWLGVGSPGDPKPDSEQRQQGLSPHGRPRRLCPFPAGPEGLLWLQEASPNLTLFGEGSRLGYQTPITLSLNARSYRQ